MRARTRDILQDCIERGIEAGYNKACKHLHEGEYPPQVAVADQIDHYIWLHIDECFQFDHENIW